MTQTATGELSPRERLLADKSVLALKTARPLLDWFREKWRTDGLQMFELDIRPDATMHGFLGLCDLDGRPETVMGCIQKLRFRKRRESPAAGSTLNSFINSGFFQAAQWTREDGTPGGFGYAPLLAEARADGSVRRLPEPGEGPFPRLDQVGDRYDWVLLKVELHDFVRSAPALEPFARTLSRFVKEAAYLAMAPDFLGGNFAGKENALETAELGYAFAPATVHPNIFGYGPGRFGAAIKLFRFALLANGDVEVGMAFLSAPRSERVFYFWGFDPFYPTVSALDFLAFRRFDLSRKIHDRMDRTFLRQHGLVHLNAIEGMRRIWENHSW